MRYRHEYKYLIESRQEAILKMKAAGIMFRDSHVGKNGSYEIHSLYFDDIHDSCIWDNVAGKDPRSKYRIRYYEKDTSYILLEKKTKKRNMTLKESCIISISECKSFMQGKHPIPDEGCSEIKKRLFTEMRTKGLKPKVIVTYVRMPYVYPSGNVRITFDTNLSSSPEILKFLDGTYIKRPIFSMGNSLMEVKWDEVMPKHIKESLQLEDLKWTAFSKYYMCRTFSLT